MALILVGCGKQNKAESLVSDFIDTRMGCADCSVSFYELNSTNKLSDSLVNVMRNDNKVFTGKFKNSDPEQSLWFIRATIVNAGNDTLVHTFYIDLQLEEVVAFKAFKPLQ